MSALRNIGNSCYMNAVLYVLRFTPAFMHNIHHLITNIILLREEMEVTTSDSCDKSKATKQMKSGGWLDVNTTNQGIIDVVIGMHNVFVNLTSYTSTSRTSRRRGGAMQQSKALQQSIHAINDTFIPLTQQDSHELLMFLLNCLRDCSHDLTDLLTTHPDWFEDIENPASKLCFDYFRTNFMGQRLSMTRCLYCETVVKHREEMIDLFVTLPSSDSKIDGNFIRNSCATKERLKDKIQCSECNRLTQTIQTTAFPHLPRILIVQLGRFQNGMTKVNTAAPIPYQLNCFCTACDSLQNDAVNEDHQYRLYGVIVHVGRTVRSGHFIAYIRSMDKDLHLEPGCEYENCCQPSVDSVDETADPNWFICNDDVITKISHSDFTSKVKSEAKTKTPYILFYVRNDVAA